MWNALFLMTGTNITASGPKTQSSAVICSNQRLWVFPSDVMFDVLYRDKKKWKKKRWKLYFVASYQVIICEFSQPPLPSIMEWLLTVNVICLRSLNWWCGWWRTADKSGAVAHFSDVDSVDSAEQEKPMEMIAFPKPDTRRIYDICGLILVPCRHKKQTFEGTCSCRIGWVPKWCCRGSFRT